MADEEGLRKEALRRHLQGEPAAIIAAELGRGERWVYKWVARYEAGIEDWFATGSRAPVGQPTATPEQTVSLVLAARDRLESDPRAQRGTAAIAWALATLGVEQDDQPGGRTIERILARAGRAKPRQRTRGRYVPKGTPYPFRAGRARAGVLHEIDPVGPRYLDGGQEVHSLNVIDVGSHRVALEPMAHPTPRALASHLVAAWARLGLPEVAQLDNHPSLRGDIGNPRAFGPVVRACLALGVRVRYVPLKEPWRNGAIEHFQDVFDKSFFRTERFTDLAHLERRARAFEAFHNAQHRYSTLRGRTPEEAWAQAGLLVTYPSAQFQIPQTLPRRGRIEVVRLIRSDQILNLFGEAIPMPEQTVHQYVVATILVRAQRLVVTHGGEIIHEALHCIR
ncbi:MAG: helix-turn-helix domain-containing protein [Actinomycetota bacterium]